MTRPERRHIHPFEERLKRALEDPDIALLYSERKGMWAVALFDPSKLHPPGRLVGFEGCESPRRRTHWLFVTWCAKPRQTSLYDRDKRPYVPIEPGEWLVPVLWRLSRRKREDVPTAARYDGAEWADFIDSYNESQDAQEEAADLEDFIQDCQSEGALVGRVYSHGRIPHHARNIKPS